jgi:SsrA-binding protein
MDWNPTKERELFLKKKTVALLQSKIREKWLTVIALKAYFKGNLIKIEVGLVRGKTAYDKRHVLKNRVLEREAKTAMSVRFR